MNQLYIFTSIQIVGVLVLLMIVAAEPAVVADGCAPCGPMHRSGWAFVGRSRMARLADEDAVPGVDRAGVLHHAGPRSASARLDLAESRSAPGAAAEHGCFTE
jgi:hypothetical protein